MSIQRPYTNPTLRGTLWLLLSLALSTCALFQSPPPHAKAHKITQTAHVDEFITQLSLVQAMLAKDPADTTAVKPHLAIIKTFTAHKQKKTVFQSAIIVSYTLGTDKEMKRLLVPFTLSEESSEFPALWDCLKALGGQTYVVHDVHPVILTVAPVKPIKVAGDNTQKIKEIVDHELQTLLLTASPLTPLEEARVQLHLLRFFIDQHMRDAAYLTADNTKQSLANAEDGDGNTYVIKNLSQQLETLENQLHQAMPFSLF